MALKSQVFSTTVNHYTLELTVVEDSTNTTANTSAVSYTLKLKSGGYDFAQYGVGASVSLNGAQVAYRDRYSAPQLSIGTYSSITLLSGTTTIAHNSDGTKTIAVAATLDMAKAYYTPGPMSISGQSMTLTTIPRATAPVVSGAATMGQAKTISLSPASSSFTHTLLYSFGNASGTIASDVKSSVSWTPPLSLASQVPDATSGTATITCHTYSGGTLIGTKTTTVTLQVPSSVVPTISGVTLSDATSGIAAQFGAYVQSKSALKVQISASSQYGATIRSYSTTVLGTTYTGSTVTTSPLGQSGTVEVSIKVTDSRGRTATTTRNISVVAYSAPRITSFSADRVDSSGSADDEGTHLKVTLALAISPVGNKNTKQYKLLYKRKSDTSYTALQTTTPSDYSYSGTLTFTASSYPEFSSDYGYDIRLQVSDYFTSVNSDDELQTAAVWLDLNISGKGVGIGKVSEKDAMEVAIPVEFLKEITADVSKTPFAAKSHTHNYAGSSSPGGAANYANALNITNSNEIRFGKSGLDKEDGYQLVINWSYADGTSEPRIGEYAFLDGSRTFTYADLRAKDLYLIYSVYAGAGVYATTMGHTLLWSGNLQSGSASIPNASKYTALIICGRPAANESLVTQVIATSAYSKVQLTSNLAYLVYSTAVSGDNMTITINENPDNGAILFVRAIVRYKA
jgi:hypothetical protein